MEVEREKRGGRGYRIIAIDVRKSCVVTCSYVTRNADDVRTSLLHDFVSLKREQASALTSLT